MKLLACTIFCLLLFACTPFKKDQPPPHPCSEYACPVHPDKTGTQAGACPQCGMKMLPVQSDSTATP